MGGKDFWFSFRQYWFTRTRAKENLSFYGPDRRKVTDIFSKRGASTPWKSLLKRCVGTECAVLSDDGLKVMLRSSRSAEAMVRNVFGNPQAADNLVKLPAFDSSVAAA